MALKNNTWKINQWYDQSVAGNVSYSGEIQLWAWGQSEKGITGQNNRTTYSSPRQIPGSTWTTEFYNNESGTHMVHSKTDGTLWSWGKASDWGQLGANNRTDRSSPTQVGSNTNWKLGGSTREGSFAIKTDGTLWGWGSNQRGELGLNNQTSYSSPTQVPGTTWDVAYGGYTSMMFIKTDGTLWMCGEGAHGRMGQNNNTIRSSPVQIGSNTDWVRGSIGNGHGHGAINTSGELWMWGNNSTGSLGQNNLTKYSSPVQIPGTWSVYENCRDAGAGIKTDGTLWMWGEGNRGMLGQNESDGRYSSPVQIPGTNWSQVSGLTYGAGGIKTDGTLWAWGRNDSGQLGQGDTNDRSSPVQIPGTAWIRIMHSGQSAAAFAFKNV